MTQVTYNEAFDPYHAAFRFFRLRLACDFLRPVPFDALRIMDFFLLFPFRLQGMRLQAEHLNWRKISKAYAYRQPYGDLPDDVTIFSRMEPFQRAAASSLAHQEFTEASSWERNQILFTNKAIPSALAARCVAANQQMGDFVGLLCEMQAKYQLGGRDGLKDRTGLLEYRYDSI